MLYPWLSLDIHNLGLWANKDKDEKKKQQSCWGRGEARISSKDFYPCRIWHDEKFMGQWCACARGPIVSIISLNMYSNRIPIHFCISACCSINVDVLRCNNLAWLVNLQLPSTIINETKCVIPALAKDCFKPVLYTFINMTQKWYSIFRKLLSFTGYGRKFEQMSWQFRICVFGCELTRTRKTWANLKHKGNDMRPVPVRCELWVDFSLVIIIFHRCCSFSLRINYVCSHHPLGLIF